MGELKHIAEQQSLVDALKNNDEQVLRTLYVENFRKTEVFILKNNGTAAQAKDFYQEAVIATWQNVKDDKFTPQSETALQGYLYTIAKNKWLDYVRSSQFKKTQRMENIVFSENGEAYDVEVNLEQEIKLNIIAENFKKLGEECRELLKQFYYQKKSLREIAEVYNIGEASARNKKYRCINKLKTLVDPQKKL